MEVHKLMMGMEWITLVDNAVDEVILIDQIVLLFVCVESWWIQGMYLKEEKMHLL